MEKRCFYAPRALRKDLCGRLSGRVTWAQDSCFCSFSLPLHRSLGGRTFFSEAASRGQSGARCLKVGQARSSPALVTSAGMSWSGARCLLVSGSRAPRLSQSHFLLCGHGRAWRSPLSVGRIRNYLSPYRPQIIPYAPPAKECSRVYLLGGMLANLLN